jgi:hypothetical protein
LRISIALVDTTHAKPSNPEFAIMLENQSHADFVVVLGYMLGSAMAGRCFRPQYPLCSQISRDARASSCIGLLH